ncbi:hypothetical protein ACMFMG_008006 [Clarireedia jacksonii]
MHAKALLVIALAGLQITAAMPLVPITPGTPSPGAIVTEGQAMVQKGHEMVQRGEDMMRRGIESYGGSNAIPQSKDLKSAAESQKNNLQNPSAPTLPDAVAPRDLESRSAKTTEGGPRGDHLLGLSLFGLKARDEISELSSAASSTAERIAAELGYKNNAAAKTRLIIDDFKDKQT